MDEKQLKSWLDAQIETHGEETGRAIAVWIAHRAAARVLPIAWEALSFGTWYQEQKLTNHSYP